MALPDESYHQSAAGITRHACKKDFLVETVGLTQLTLHPVAVDSVMQETLWDTDQNPYTCATEWHETENRPYGII